MGLRVKGLKEERGLSLKGFYISAQGITLGTWGQILQTQTSNIVCGFVR